MTDQADTTRAPLNPSALMSAYNYAKHYGRKTGQFDTKRVDRALGYMMNGEWEVKTADYAATFTRCDCPDSKYRHQVCKHSIALMVAAKHDEIMEAEGFRQAA